MKAVVFHEFGGLDVLQVEAWTIRRPAPARSSSTSPASALNHLDVDIREGVSASPSSPAILGVEVVGRVAEVGGVSTAGSRATA